MDENTRKEFILLFNQGFEEIVRPEIEELRKEVVTKKEFAELKGQVERIERKLDHFSAKSTELDGRVTKLEAKSAVIS